jgi:hypothetical protein
LPDGKIASEAAVPGLHQHHPQPRDWIHTPIELDETDLRKLHATHLEDAKDQGVKLSSAEVLLCPNEELPK